MDGDEIEVIIPPSEPEEPEVTEEDVDELVELVNEVKTTGDGHTETLGRIEACLTRLEAQQQNQAQSPLLAEIKAELVELRAELERVKSSMVSISRSPEPNQSEETPEPVTVVETSEPPAPENLTVEVPDGNAETPPELTEPKRRRWV